MDKKWSNNLIKYIENGAILEKKAKISEFKYYHYSGGDNDDSESGYDLICTDGNNKYQYRLKSASCIGSKEPNNKLFEEIGITYVNDREGLKKEIKGKIKYLEGIKQYSSFFEKFKIRKEIFKCKKALLSLEKYQLIQEGHHYYFGDYITVYVDPHNNRNYYMDLDGYNEKEKNIG